MTLTPLLRKFTLTTHVTFSVGWLGAVAGFLALAIAGLTSKDIQVVRSTYLSMKLIGWLVIVPACLGALLSGVVQALGTQWGLFKYYWVLIKLLLTVGATVLLIVHMQPVGFIADIVAKRAISNSEFSGLRVQLVADAGVALFVLLAATALSVYKPWGQIRYTINSPGQNEMVPTSKSIKVTSLRSYIAFGFIFLALLLFIILHLFRGGLGGH